MRESLCSNFLKTTRSSPEASGSLYCPYSIEGDLRTHADAEAYLESLGVASTFG